MDIKKEFRDYAVKHLGVNGLAADQYMGIYGPTNLTPYIMEERRLNVAQMDVFSRLMMDRIIFLGTGIDDRVANIVTAQLLFPKVPILLKIFVSISTLPVVVYMPD